MGTSAARQPSARTDIPAVILVAGLVVFAVLPAAPGVRFPGFQQWVLVLVAGVLAVLSFALSPAGLTAPAFRAATGLLFVLVYLHARQALLPEGWVPKNEWDEAWRVPWAAVLLAALIPFWLATLGRRRPGERLTVRGAWTLAAAFIVATALIMFGVLHHRYPQAIEFGGTLSVSLKAMEAAVVFAIASRRQRVGAVRLLTLVTLGVALLKAVVL